MEIRVLRYFYTAAIEGSMTKAAEILHVSQPALSRQIRDLEEELHVKLFNRTNYAIVLTEEGELMKKRAEDILRMVDSTTEEFLHLDDMKGEISVGIMPSVNNSLLYHAMENIGKQYPEIRFTIYNGTLEYIYSLLDRNALDFAFVCDEIDTGKYSYNTLPIKDVYGLYVPPDSSLKEKKEILLKELMQYPLLLPEDGMKRHLSRYMGPFIETINQKGLYTRMEDALEMMNRNLGCVLGLKNSAVEEKYHFIPLSPKLEIPTYIIWKKHSTLKNTAYTLREEIKTLRYQMSE